MRRRQLSVTSVVALLLAVCGGRSTAHATSPILLFAVFEHRGGMVIDPVVRIGRDRLSQPSTLFDPSASDEQLRVTLRRFETDEYPRGRTLRLLYGGAEVGTATVIQPVEIGCISQIAAVQLRSSVPIPTDDMALATASTSPARGQVRRRSPTVRERTAALEVARRAYRQQGLRSSVLGRIAALRLVTTDLDGDGRAEMIGTFLIEEPKARHALFLIAEPQRGDRYRATLVSYQRSGDVEDGKDYEEQVFVDHANLGRSATDVVVVRVDGWESHRYVLYEKRAGRWSAVYRGGGFGC